MKSPIENYYIQALTNLKSAPSSVESNFATGADSFLRTYTIFKSTCDYCKSSVFSTNNCINCGAPTQRYA